MIVCGLALGACQDEAPPQAKPPTRVGSLVVGVVPLAPTVVLTGTIAARVESDLSFRVAGRILERMVDVGDHVGAGDVLATLSTEEQEADVASAEATVAAGEATLRQAETNFARQKRLLDGGYTTKSTFDAAQEALRTADSALKAARAELGSARDVLTYTVLRADAPGIVTARNAEAGQVVEAAETVFSLANDGARDAVFDLYEGALANKPNDDGRIDVVLAADPRIATIGKVREIAPTFDATTGTIRVKVALTSPPKEMALGSAVVGAAHFAPRDVVILPWTALSSVDGEPSVWIVDPASGKVSQRRIAIERYRTGDILVGKGLAAGDVVVTAGVQLLRDGEVVSTGEVAAK